MAVLFIAHSSHSEEPKKVFCELEGNYSITYDDFRRNYFNEAVEIAKNVAVTTTQSIFFLNRAKQTLNKDAWDKNKIDVIQYWALDENSDDLLKLDYVVEPAPVWVTQSDWVKEKKETGIMVTHFIENGAMHPNYPEYKFDIYNNDALSLPIWKLGNGPREVIANLPYNISTKILLSLLKNSSEFSKLTMPDESYHGINFNETFGKHSYINFCHACVLRDLGTTMAPFNAYLTLTGIETLK